jgi:putative membrane protein insertion efficiency factor
MAKIIIFLINLYQKTPTRIHNSCIFIPTCSQYTKEAVIKYGFWKGVFLGIKRVSRCHPWQKNKYNPVK